MQPSFERWEEDKAQIAQELKLNPSLFQFLFIGHNYRRKGLDKLLKALSLLKSEEFQLSIIGNEKNKPRFQEQAKQLGIANNVFFFGARSDLLRFYQMADCLVIPSLYDPFANVTLEALAMGLFVVSSSTNGGSEILTAENGAVIPTLYDPHTFAETLKIALSRSKTSISANRIRTSIAHLDFSSQLRLITEMTLK
jgi:UDP-glucose:(heptosyl)LPS alpha-1,3-glucosyltransferase